jgi:pyruvate/2-oxoglutarate dehydrogenase complex dihydrolipoamide dehydrogenase (E3) component
MARPREYDAIVIGAGQAGGPLATALGKTGKKTALIEREHVGGTCINEGCTPTKTMVASARVAYLAGRGADYGVKTGAISVDMKKVRKRKRDIVESFRSGSERRIKESKNVDLLEGEATFTGPHTIEVRLSGKTVQLTADTIIINTGARPSLPEVEGISEVGALDSTSIMELDSAPEHLIVLGGGYIGLEFGQMFHRFGSKVTVVQRAKQLLGREDADVAEEIAKILREDGLEIMLEAEALSVKKDGKGNIKLAVKTPSGKRTIKGSHLLAAAGRTPNTDTLNPQAAGVKMDKRGFIPVNERLETNVEGIYAVGDVNGGPAFTHISYDDFRILRTNLVEGGRATTKDRLVPYTVFIDPQLGRVGMSEQEAREQGRKIRVAKIGMDNVARALEVDESRGFMKAIVDAKTGQILGCAVLGLEGGEIMAMMQIAMMGKVPYTTLEEGIFAHPTLAESLNTIFMNMEGGK